ncbi:MAG: hypothetical protein LBV19_03635 [Streptococcaceae bacterium]|jgi:hypothetical protein|nr:hypothetical protein [Streptococcaceae bacterium]
MNSNKTLVAITAIPAIAIVALAVRVSVKFNLYSKLGSLEFSAEKSGFIKGKSKKD